MHPYIVVYGIEANLKVVHLEHHHGGGALTLHGLVRDDTALTWFSSTYSIGVNTILHCWVCSDSTHTPSPGASLVSVLKTGS